MYISHNHQLHYLIYTPKIFFVFITFVLIDHLIYRMQN
jgi:hypothetical protein